MSRVRVTAVVVAVGMVGLGLMAGAAGGATPGRFSEDIRFVASGGVSLQTTLTGSAPPVAGPVVVGFSPYRPGGRTFHPGPAYNLLPAQIRGPRHNAAQVA